jgi:hypothetical protein
MSTITQKHNSFTWTTALVIQICSIVAAVSISFALVQADVKEVTTRVEKIEAKQIAYGDSITSISITLGRVEERVIALQEGVAIIREQLGE